MQYLRIVWSFCRIFIRGSWWLLRYLFLVGFIWLSLHRSTYPTELQANQINLIVSEHLFDYIGWEVDAIIAKVNQTLFGVHPYMDEVDRSQYVRDYFDLLTRTRELEAQIEAIYIDPAVEDPDEATVDLRAERDSMRAELRSRQPLAEGILEGQVAAVLVEQGFGTGGQLIPPIAMHFTRMPMLLVVSPRDEIRFESSINLNPLPIDGQISLEEAIEADLDVSSLIVPLGGMALYPAMINETTSIPFAVEVFAHEWLHHYLFFFPLGYNYITGDSFASDTRVINETTADLFGKEVARLVLERYYPDLVPPPPPPAESDEAGSEPSEPAPLVFDFGAEMHETRVTVDEMLAEGRVEEAEAYMEARRALFVRNGYRIRRINQAYFAFYGGYQGGTPGIAGDDPIGPSIYAIRAASPTLLEFVLTMQNVVTRDDLLTTHDRVVAP